MRLIIGLGSRLYVWESSVSKVHMKLASEAEEEVSPEAPAPDPHGTVNVHCELSPHAVFDSALDGAVRRTVNAPGRFGFGRQAPD